MGREFHQWFYATRQDAYLAQINYYLNAVTHKVLPAFDNLADEAVRFQDDEYKRLSQIIDPESLDTGEIADILQDRSVSHYLAMTDVAQALTNLFVAGLFHLFEQQLVGLNRATPRQDLFTDHAIPDFVAILKAQDIDANGYAQWLTITEELRWIADTVKHGEAKKTKKLKELRPDLFRPDRANADISHAEHTVGQPLAGESIFLTKDDLLKYGEAIKSFWIELGKWG